MPSADLVCARRFYKSFGRAFSKDRGVKRQGLLSPVATGEISLLAFLCEFSLRPAVSKESGETVCMPYKKLLTNFFAYGKMKSLKYVNEARIQMGFFVFSREFMRKTNNNIKRLKFAKILFCFALVQGILIWGFAHCFFDLVPIQENQTEQVTIEVISTGYWETPFSKHVFTVYSDTDSYVFSNPGIFGKYSNNDLYQSIQQGDVISLRYVKDVNVFGKAEKRVVAAQTESQVYRSIEEHNNLAKKAILPFFLITFVVEGLFLVVLILFIALHKHLFKKKKKSRG